MDDTLTATLAKARSGILERMASAARACGRDPSEVVLTAVAKTQARATLEAMVVAGQQVFGENRVQEGQAHWQDWTATPVRPQLRLIGPLQTNKARDAVDLFDVIETLDRLSLVEAIARAAQKAGRCPQLLVQVNTGAEPQKAGVLAGDLPALLDAARTASLPICGLMCIPPADDDPQPHFRLLAALAAKHGLPQLSMGMSGDFETAIACGATHVRVGTALFGSRT
jgi:PLP dependent protein